MTQPQSKTDPKPRIFGTTPFEVIQEITGLEYLQGVLKGKYPEPTIHQTLGIQMLEIEEGNVAFSGVPNDCILNPLGTVHGGYISALLDSALACCVHTLCPAGYASTSLELKVNFVRPITPETGRLFARGQVVHPGRNIATSEARLTDQHGKLYAHGTQTCSIFKL